MINMKCENCGRNEANVKYTQIINGEKKQMFLCEECSEKLGINDIHFNMSFQSRGKSIVFILVLAAASWTSSFTLKQK